MIAYFDCFSGISGDMTLGALLDLGVDFQALERELARLGVGGYSLAANKVVRSGISATDFTVRVHGEPPEAAGAPASGAEHARPAGHSAVNDAYGSSDRGEAHAHDAATTAEAHAGAHAHSHSHGAAHSHSHGEADGDAPPAAHGPASASPAGHAHLPAHAPHRNLADIEAIIDGGSLSETVRNRSKEIFRRIAVAEAKIHNTSVDRIHFHEVGGIDCIVDIVGSVIALEMLDVTQVYGSALPCGHGFVACAHGLMPVPAPATLELLRGAPVVNVDVEGELVTPTGAAILTTLAKGLGAMPAMTVERVGYGAGKKQFGPQPNLLRVVLGRPVEAGERGSATPVGPQPTALSVPPREVAVIEANIDDLSPEIYEYVMQRLFAAGALDVTFTPIAMKKNRPAIQLSAICEPERVETLASVIFRETSTFGVRTSRWDRYCLDRELRTVETPWGFVNVKIGRWKSKTLTVSPEYEDCRRLARERRVPLKEVYRAALLAAGAVEEEETHESDL